MGTFVNVVNTYGPDGMGKAEVLAAKHFSDEQWRLEGFVAPVFQFASGVLTMHQYYIDTEALSEYLAQLISAEKKMAILGMMVEIIENKKDVEPSLTDIIFNHKSPWSERIMVSLQHFIVDIGKIRTMIEDKRPAGEWGELANKLVFEMEECYDEG